MAEDRSPWVCPDPGPLALEGFEACGWWGWCMACAGLLGGQECLSSRFGSHRELPRGPGATSNLVATQVPSLSLGQREVLVADGEGLGGTDPELWDLQH